MCSLVMSACSCDFLKMQLILTEIFMIYYYYFRAYSAWFLDGRTSNFKCYTKICYTKIITVISYVK